jgi:hypothetical protein
MAGLQSIINASNGLMIDRRKMVGIQYTRNEIPRVSQTPTRNPWKFTLDLPSSYRYNEARSLMEALDTIDRTTPQVITFSENGKLDWIFRYQGSMSLANRNAITVQSFVGNQLVLQNLPVIASTRVLFEPNDLIQIGTNYYPFTSTTQVTRGTGSTVTVTTNRPNIITASVVGSNITVGNSCRFTMFCPNMPTYKLIPGGYQKTNGVLVGNALIEFTDAFQLYEFVGTA